MLNQHETGSIAVVYVGDHARIECRFPEHNLCFTFEKGVPRFFRPEVAKLFRPSRHWLVGEFDMSSVGKLRDKTHVVIRRAVALGDVIAVHGAAQAIIRAYPEYAVSIQVDPRYTGLFVRHPTYFRVFSVDEQMSIVPVDKVVSLDGVFELDHTSGNEKVSRVTKVWQYFFRGEVAKYENLKPDFRVIIPEEDKAFALGALARLGLDPESRRGRPLIATATRAVQHQRNLGADMVKDWTHELVKTIECDVLLIENDGAHIWRGPNIHSIIGTTIPQALALIEMCDVLCSMDSGAMWLGHCAAIPMVVWFGPTPPETKINWHPLYPDGIRSIEMNKWINCPACYEDASACNWRFSCIRETDRARFNRETTQAVIELLEARHGEVKKKTCTV